mmetsp:Transcript_13282/g.12870  ORF Transcript_13282/g.12870 Transcript_13282/m.12870 type:complete len:259 (-) Transcript_13282:325-1101(-)
MLVGNACTVLQVVPIPLEMDTMLTNPPRDSCNDQDTFPVPLENTRPTRGKKQRSSETCKQETCNVQETCPIPLEDKRPRGKRQNPCDALIPSGCFVQEAFPVSLDNTGLTRGKRQRSAEMNQCDTLVPSRSNKAKLIKKEGDMKGSADDDKEQEVSKIQSKLSNEVVVSNFSPDSEDLTNRYIRITRGRFSGRIVLCMSRTKTGDYNAKTLKLPGIKSQQTTLGKKNTDLHYKGRLILTPEEQTAIEENDLGRENVTT